ncbi:proline dehydrogenase family protein [Streptomyces sp. NPDC002073]|uniref:proline dehydrogenase family protein n=1 Tax=Streptomyces sp. NBC_00239 TaxID=2903640 RepID=UPI002E2A5F94|nr:proline dehydrogenase family protein [Streptomyces sp. NBC_00239]
MTTMNESSQRALLEAAAEGLRKIATDTRSLAAFAAPGSALRELLSPAARRYVLAPDRAGFLTEAAQLRAKGYRVTAEFAPADHDGDDPAHAERAVVEHLALLAQEGAPDQVGFDLSGMGLALSRELALENTGRIAAAAAARGSEIVLSMERYPSVDSVLAVHHELCGRYPNVGVTLQAHLHRTEHDAAAVARPGRRIRLVKGAFPEPAHIALGRGPALDDRYLSLARYLVDAGARLSLATHDPVVLEAARESGLLARVAEVEMRYGVQPGLLRAHREAGRTCRVNATYGTNWWLHLLQRLTEHPPMVLRALADIGTVHAPTTGQTY